MIVVGKINEILFAYHNNNTKEKGKKKEKK